MDKVRKNAAIIVGMFMIMSIWTMVLLKRQIKSLENEMGRINSNIINEIGNNNYAISKLREELLNKMERDESLLSSFETEYGFKDGQLEITVKVVPKEKHIDERVFLSLGNEKKEAISNDDSTYMASFTSKASQRFTPIVVFESSLGMRQESLPEIYMDELFSLEYESMWDFKKDSSGKDRRIIILNVYPQQGYTHKKPYSLLDKKTNAKIVIKDAFTDANIVNKDMQLIKGESSFNKDTLFKADLTNLTEYLEKEGSYAIWIEMNTEDGVFYREPIAYFDYYGGNDIFTTSQGGTLYPIW